MKVTLFLYDFAFDLGFDSLSACSDERGGNLEPASNGCLDLMTLTPTSV